MEYIYTNLPRYEKLTSRNDLKNSEVKTDHVLLFSEEAGKLTAKLPDGSFVSVGGSCDFYKCASVDTAAGTWTGYKWNLNDEGVYELETELTTDELTVMGFEPVVGNIYSADTLIMAGKLYTGPDPMPTDALLFHASLASDSGVADFGGQTLTEVFNTDAASSEGIVYGVVDNIPCAYFNGNSYITFPDTGFPADSIYARSFSLWFKADYDMSAGTKAVPFAYGYQTQWNETMHVAGIAFDGSGGGGGFYNKEFDPVGIADGTFQRGEWYHVAVVYERVNNQYSMRGYVNGVLSENINQHFSLSTLEIGSIGRCLDPNMQYRYTGYLAGVRLYGRALTLDEIKILNNEFRGPYIDIADTLSLSFKPNEPISHSLDAKDSLGNACSYEVISDILPTGVEFDASTGTFSGTPTAEGEGSIVVRCYTNKAEKEVTVAIRIAYSSLSVSGQLWGYKNGEFLFDNTITATATGTPINADAGITTFNSNNYFTLDETVLTGASGRTFIFHAALSDTSCRSFIDGGVDNEHKKFSLGYGWDGNAGIFYRLSFDDNSSFASLSTGTHIIAIVYDGTTLKAYADKALIGSYNVTLDTGADNRYRIGCGNIDGGANSEWTSKFYAIYDRALTDYEIATITDEINNA